MITNKAGNPVLNLQRDIDRFTRAYIECALWSSHDESTPSGGEPMDANYSWTDIADETLASMIEDCRKFQEANSDALARAFYPHSGATDDEYAGHDFWLTRNGHGAGFWDRGLPDDVGDKLTEAAHAFGEYNLYVGDDGKIYS